MSAEDEERDSYSAKVYNPDPAREETRGALARGLLWLLTFTVGGVLVFIAMGYLDGAVLVQSIFPSLIALAGTALGFYFGSQSTKNGNSPVADTSPIFGPPPPPNNPDSSTPAPTVSEITPVSGPKEGGTAVIIKGSGFNADTVVYLGETLAEIVSKDASTINATTPPHDEGVVDVKVINTDNKSGILIEGFTFT